MFPSEPRLVKNVHADTSLTGRHFAAHGSTEEYRVAIPNGSAVIVDIWAIHMSREYLRVLISEQADPDAQYPRLSSIVLGTGCLRVQAGEVH